jgi:hypothetical protein
MIDILGIIKSFTAKLGIGDRTSSFLRMFLNICPFCPRKSVPSLERRPLQSASSALYNALSLPSALAFLLRVSSQIDAIFVCIDRRCSSTNGLPSKRLSFLYAVLVVFVKIAVAQRICCGGGGGVFSFFRFGVLTSYLCSTVGRYLCSSACLCFLVWISNLGGFRLSEKSCLCRNSVAFLSQSCFCMCF